MSLGNETLKRENVLYTGVAKLFALVSTTLRKQNWRQ